jgi:signal transduction histidine kinase
MRPGARAASAGRRTIRLRLTVIYSGLFLLTGAALLAFTYAFVVRGLGPVTKTQPAAVANQAFKKECANAMSRAKTPGTRSAADQNLIVKCEQSFSAGVFAGATAQRTRAIDQLELYSLIGLGGMAVVSGAVGWLLAGRALRPVHVITAAARKASEENLGERLRLGGPRDELRDLADTFDAMLGRLEAAFASQSRFVANASHELRTPITVMRTAIDVTLAKPDPTLDQLTDMAVEVAMAAGRAESLIEALLTLARSDRGGLRREQADLGVLAEDALDAAAPAIRAGALRVETALEPAPTSGDVVLLDRLVANLVDNAVRHNSSGGWIQVATGMRGDAAYVAVTNGGVKIPEDVAPQLFEPFWRLNGNTESPGGAGLGLSIIRSVTNAHHGSVVVRARPAGGLDVSVLLPGSPPDATGRAGPSPAHR